MRDLLLEYQNAKHDESKIKILNEIMKMVANTNSGLDILKRCIYDVGHSNKFNSLLYYVFGRLDFIPEPTDIEKLPRVVYRGTEIPPSQVIKNDGFKKKYGSKCVLKHKKETGSSIYVSTSKNIKIAMEHACQFPSKWVYKIVPLGGICTSSFFDPFDYYRMEEEVIFPYEIPLSQIKEVAIARDWDNFETDFYPLQCTVGLPVSNA